MFFRQSFSKIVGKSTKFTTATELGTVSQIEAGREEIHDRLNRIISSSTYDFVKIDSRMIVNGLLQTHGMKA